MTASVFHSMDAPVTPELQGHTVAFVDTDAACDAVMQALNAAGFRDAKLQVLWGEDGLHLLERIADASAWGETAEEVLKRGEIELRIGHSLVFVERCGSRHRRRDHYSARRSQHLSLRVIRGHASDSLKRPRTQRCFEIGDGRRRDRH